MKQVGAFHRTYTAIANRAGHFFESRILAGERKRDVERLRLRMKRHGTPILETGGAGAKA